MQDGSSQREDERIASNLRRAIELTEIGLDLRRSVIQQHEPQGDAMVTVMRDSPRQRASMAAESFLAQTLSTLITDFNRRGFQYALAGGWAYSALVEPRATTDIDILLLLEQPSRDRLQSLLTSLFDSIIVTVEDLILLKTLAGRLQDQADLEKIKIRQDDLRVDWAYVRKWKAKLGLAQ